MYPFAWYENWFYLFHSKTPYVGHRGYSRNIRKVWDVWIWLLGLESILCVINQDSGAKNPLLPLPGKSAGPGLLQVRSRWLSWNLSCHWQLDLVKCTSHNWFPETSFSSCFQNQVSLDRFWLGSVGQVSFKFYLWMNDEDITWRYKKHVKSAQKLGIQQSQQFPIRIIPTWCLFL